MATTKDYLRLAILGGGSKGACISDTKVSISPNASAGQSSSYATTTAPFDGVVSFGLVATETNHNGAGPWFSVSGKNNKQNLNASWFQTGGSWSFIPCRKGEQITYGGSGVKFTVINFYKSIGGGYKRYLKALSCNRFGGLLWLRLKTTSETFRRLGVASRSRVGKLLISNLSVRPRGLGAELTSHLLTGILPYGLMQRPMLMPKPFRAMPASSCQRILKRSGLGALSLAGRGKSVHTPCSAMGSFKERRCSFIQRVACNNARMEVAA